MIDIVEDSARNEVKMFIGHELGIKMMDLQTATAEDVFYNMDGKSASPSATSPAILGKSLRKESNTSKQESSQIYGRPIKVVHFPNNVYVLCYQRKNPVVMPDVPNHPRRDWLYGSRGQFQRRQDIYVAQSSSLCRYEN